MNSFILDKTLLNIGNKSIDISNVSHDKEERARRFWNESLGFSINEFGEVTTTDKTAKKQTQEEYFKMVETVGLMMIRQDFMVLRRRFSLFGSIKEYIKRLSLTSKFLRKSTNEEYMLFHDWVKCKITGCSLEDLKKKNVMTDLAIQVNDMIEKMGETPETCLESLRILLGKMDGLGKQSKVIQEK